MRPESNVVRALRQRPELLTPDAVSLVVAVGKAAAGMLRGALAVFSGAVVDGTGLDGTVLDGAVLDGAVLDDTGLAGFGRAGQRQHFPRALVLLPEGADAGDLPSQVTLLRGGHPHPTEESFVATRRILTAVDALGDGQRLLVLLSGGTSALLEAPVAGLGAGDLVAAHRALVASGLPIATINRVRGCLSAVKAGGLAARAWPGIVTTLALSDVEGDDPAVIGSGPTWTGERVRLGDDLLAALTELALPPAVLRILQDGRRPSGQAFSHRQIPSDYAVVASIAEAREAAVAELRARGFKGSCPALGANAYLRGSTEKVAQEIVAYVDQAVGAANSVAVAARAYVFGGEPTVAVTADNPGRGGRNLDLAARLALAWRGRGGVAAVVAGTDGCDGSSTAAGAIVDGGTAARAEAAGYPMEAALAAFDTETALAAAGDLFVTGPTGTNVGDLVVVLVRESAAP